MVWVFKPRGAHTKGLAGGPKVKVMTVPGGPKLVPVSVRMAPPATGREEMVPLSKARPVTVGGAKYTGTPL